MKITKLSLKFIVLVSYVVPMIAMQKNNNYKMSIAALQWYQQEIERLQQQNSLYPNSVAMNADGMYIEKLKDTKLEYCQQMKINKSEQEKLTQE